MAAHRLLFSALLLCPLIAGADTVKLKSGEDLHGSIESQNATSITLRTGKSSRTVARADVASVSYEMEAIGSGKPSRAKTPKKEDKGSRDANVVLYRRTECYACDRVRDYLTNNHLRFTTINMDKSPDDAMWMQQKCLADRVRCDAPMVLIRGRIYTYGATPDDTRELKAAVEKEAKRHR